MKISSIGEFGLIDLLKKRLHSDGSVIKGIGDDCAVVEAGMGRYTLLTCDMIVEKVDFRPAEKPALIGRKALAISLSDIAACGGIPKFALVSLGLPRGFSVAKVEAIYKGMEALARQFGVSIVGGDISSTPVLTLDVSVYGSVEKQNLVLRSGAQPGDTIFVTGSFGGSIKGKHLSFVPRLKESRYLVTHFRINSMIDCSDGLAADLGHIMEQSKTGCVIFENLVPKSKDARDLDDALYSGEDFELIFTASPDMAEDIAQARGFEFHPIGTVTGKRSGLRIVNIRGASRKLQPKGYRHF
ncbi:MAG: thiamine-phosphate kinase [Deltaproteobacteria bacterium]